MDNLSNNVIMNVVSGLITNGINGIYNYITKETLQDHIANVIESVQEIYEKEYKCKSKSLFIWNENIKYFTQWIKDGFLPRENIELPCPYGIDKSIRLSENEIKYIYQQLDKLVKEDRELCCLHASNLCDEIYRMLYKKEQNGINPDYYNYVKSYGNVLLLHRAEEKRAITLSDTYIMPDYTFAESSSIEEKHFPKDLMKLLIDLSKDNTNRVTIIEGDAGVGKSSLISHICFQNEKLIQESGLGIFDNRDIYCVRLRNLTMKKSFIEVPVNYIIESLGFQTYTEYEILSNNAVILLDGFDELCMIDGMIDFAEYVLAEIIRGFSDNHIIITTRPKFLNVNKLKEKGIFTGINYIILKHFDFLKRNEWIQKYKSICDSSEYAQLDKIAGIDDGSSEGICDTPLALYLLAAGKITDEAWNNPWVLYHQIFQIELSTTEYNKLFSNRLYTHSISRYNDVLYQISAEIAYKMYMTGNKKLYVTQHDIDEIVDYLKLGKDNEYSLMKRCYALCNYWKSDGKSGIAEFYHNNIRDFFLCEKIYYELEKIYLYFREDCLNNEHKRDAVVAKFIFSFGNLFHYSDFNDKVSEFIYYRSLYKMNSKKEEDFVKNELKHQFLAWFFEKMFVHGAIHDYSYDGKRNLYQEHINVLKCVVQIYRHIYEPYVYKKNKRIKWFINIQSELNELEGFPHLFKPVFIRTPLTLSSDYNIPVAGYANFNIFDMKKADLRYGMFSYSKFVNCNFSDTILVSSDFSNAILKSCNFENADFKYSSLLNADIKNCNFNNCNLIGTTLPDGFCSTVQEEQIEHIMQFT